jgi:hypothetical protein
MYERVLDDPKVQMLTAEDFRSWVNLLCLASRNGGQLPSVREIAFALRIDANDVSTLLERLLSATLIDRRSGGVDGAHYAPHNWSELQYKSDTSTDRVKRFRERSRNEKETGPETETETENTTSGAKAPSVGRGDLAFEGKVIRLNKEDFARWQRTYHSIADLAAELLSIDHWLQEQPETSRKRWFHSVPGMLGRKHQELLAAKKKGPSLREYINGPMRG